MKILVPVKRVIDYHVRVRVNREHTDVVKDNVKMSMNPFDEIALEAALQLKEQGVATEVCLVSVGTQASQETLRHGLAMGADKAFLVETDEDPESLHIAKILQKIVADEQPELVLLGKQAIDNDCNQVGQMLAGLLDWSQATYASVIKYEGNRFVVTREVDGGLETISVAKPAVISADLRLNKPRFVSLPNIMKAKSKIITTLLLADMNLSFKPHVKILGLEEPPRKSAGIKVKDFAELMDKLKEADLV
ncbi:MAG: electron transfer flavoprotein subunit beta [Coxiella sp. (in: Bacteria)]|nr:MAG: electron transfer flavoprotein subunit beta [Coxiella sp. (in: g-proteobacteria)]